MIYITGDLHGGMTAYHVSSKAFRPAKRGDIVICTGDFGGVWWPDYHTNEKHRRDEDYFLESKLRQRATWLAVDGNHENFARLFGGEFPLVEIYGGLAYQVRKNIFYLKRGEIFTIEGETFLAFGGARSHDKEPGWLTPALAWSGFGGREWNKGRTEGVDWWPEEIPSEADYENACRNLDRVGWQVDHVITHTCPASQRQLFMRERKSDPTEAMLQRFLDNGLEFNNWHFGHFHLNEQLNKFYCHFDKIQQLPLARKTLSDLLDLVTDENIHAEVQTGAPVGKEILSDLDGK
jgi:hypothetical protein